MNQPNITFIDSPKDLRDIYEEASVFIGLIEKINGKYRATTTKTNNVLFDKSLESSINDLLSYFTLHEK